MARKLQGRLFTVYSWGAKFGFVVSQQVSILGGLFLCLAPIVSFMAVIYPRVALFMLAGLLTAALIVSPVTLLFRRAQLRVVRHLPKYATAKEEIEYTVICENKGLLPLDNYFLVEHAPDPRPSRELFMNSTEPGEALRNKFDQTFLAYRWMWIVKQRLLFKSHPSLGLRLAPKAQGMMTLSLRPLRRGVMQLDRLNVILPDPLGLFQKVRRVEQEQETLIVLPKRYALGEIRFDGVSKSQLGGDAHSSMTGQSGEFTALREYRPGDPPKHIHWPSWGRTGRPIVKEFEEVFYPRYGLLLDTAVRAEEEAVFEEAISVAASFATAVDTERALLDCMFAQQGAQVHTIGKNMAQVDSMLELLAGLEMEARPDWKELKKVVMLHAEELATCVLVFCNWDKHRRDLVHTLMASDTHVCVLIISEGGEKADIKDCPAELHYLHVGRIEEGLLTLSSL